MPEWRLPTFGRIQKMLAFHSLRRRSCGVIWPLSEASTDRCSRVARDAQVGSPQGVDNVWRPIASEALGACGRTCGRRSHVSVLARPEEEAECRPVAAAPCRPARHIGRSWRDTRAGRRRESPGPLEAGGRGGAGFSWAVVDKSRAQVFPALNETAPASQGDRYRPVAARRGTRLHRRSTMLRAARVEMQAATGGCGPNRWGVPRYVPPRRRRGHAPDHAPRPAPPTPRMTGRDLGIGCGAEAQLVRGTGAGRAVEPEAPDEPVRSLPIAANRAPGRAR